MNDAVQKALDALELLAKYENPLTRWTVRKPRKGAPLVTIYPQQVVADAADALRAAIAQQDGIDGLIQQRDELLAAMRAIIICALEGKTINAIAQTAIDQVGGSQT